MQYKIIRASPLSDAPVWDGTPKTAAGFSRYAFVRVKRISVAVLDSVFCDSQLTTASAVAASAESFDHCQPRQPRGSWRSRAAASSHAAVRSGRLRIGAKPDLAYYIVSAYKTQGRIFNETGNDFINRPQAALPALCESHKRSRIEMGITLRFGQGAASAGLHAEDGASGMPGGTCHRHRENAGG